MPAGATARPIAVPAGVEPRCRTLPPPSKSPPLGRQLGALSPHHSQVAGYAELLLTAKPAPKRFRLELDEITFWWIGLEDIHDAFDPLRRGDAARRVILFDA